MKKRKREPVSEGKNNIIAGLLQEYDIKTAKDIEDALKELLSGTIQEMLEHPGYSSYERSDNTDYRNGKESKKIYGNFGETEIEVPQDRDGSFEPKVVQHCIVHQVRNALKYVGEKNKKQEGTCQ